MPLLTKPQYGYIIGLYKKLGMELTEDDKHVIGCLSIQDAQAHIQKLKEALRIDDPLNDMRRAIISMAKSIGWLIENPDNPQEPKADMDRIENWCMKYGQHHKALNDLNKKELAQTLKQFQFGPYKTKMDK